MKENTGEKERVFNMTMNFVLFYSNRYPANKYDDSMYFGFFPSSQYYDTITRDPARVVVYDTNLTRDWKILKNWEYTKFLKENYVLAKTFGAFEIYTLDRSKL